jgi:putative colanic acid biosysnthesis UDP-glucose lipid carrier transferase
MQRTYIPSIRAKVAADLLLMALIIFLMQDRIILSGVKVSFNLTLLMVIVCQTCWFVCGRIVGLYKDYRAIPFSVEFTVFMKSLALYAVSGSFLFFLLFKGFPFSRVDLLFHITIICLLFPVQKLAIRVFLKKIRRSSQLTRKVLIVGAGDQGVDFYTRYVKDQHYGYALTGFIDDIVNPSLNGHYLGKTTDIDQVIANHELDDIIVTMPMNNESQLASIVNAGEKQGKRVRIIPHYERFGSGRIHVGTLGSLPIITLRSLPLDVVDNKIYKRIFDLLFASAVTLFVLSWLLPILSLIIKLSSKGPVFFKQERWGLNNKSIVCYKFRSMQQTSKDLDESGIYQQAKKNDPRITKIGKFLRKTNMDELPQFINVLLGSMSVVGPRPHPVPLNIQSKDSIENYMLRHWVKPGITGWAQVNGYRGETKQSYLMKKRVEFDVWYIENWTFWLDLQIIMQTLVNMVKGDKNAY